MIDTIKHEKEYANYVLGKINYYYVNYIERLEKNVADKKGQKVDKNKELIINMNKGIKNFICPRIEYMSPAVLIRCLE